MSAERHYGNFAGIPIAETSFLPPGTWMIVSDNQIICSPDTWRRIQWMWGGLWERFSVELDRRTRERMAGAQR